MGSSLLLSVLYVFNTLFSASDALTLSPSVVACDGEQVVLTCTANQTFVQWTVSTPTMNYTNIETDNNDMEQRTDDGVLIFRVTSYTPSPLELVATVTVSASQNLNGTLVECASLISGVARRETSVLTLADDPTSFSLTLPDTSDLEFGRTNITAINVSWTPQDGVNYVIAISPPIPYNNASRTNITIPNVPFNTQYNITVGAINRCGASYTASTSLNYTRCVFPSISPRVVSNVTDGASSPEGTVLVLSCKNSIQSLVGVNIATCVEGVWIPDVNETTCRGECGLPVFADGVVVVDNFTARFEGSSFNFTCTDGLSPTTIIRTDCTAEGHWSPDPATHMCINASDTTTAVDMTTNITTDSTSTSSSGQPFSPSVTEPNNNTGAIAGGVVGGVAGIIIVVLIIIMVICLTRKRSEKPKKRTNGMNNYEDEVPMGEYNRTTHNAPVAPVLYSTTTHTQQAPRPSQPPTEEYSTLQHGMTKREKKEQPVAVLEEYSEIRVDSNKPPRKNVQTETGEQYSVLQTETGGAYPPSSNASTVQVETGEQYSVIQNKNGGGYPPPNNDVQNSTGGLVYADLGPRKRPAGLPVSPPINEPVVYSDITGTITLSPANATKAPPPPPKDPDGSLDLNMMLIQVREVIPDWYAYGGAIGVPTQVLDEMRNMQCDDYGKLVEMADYWFHIHSRDPAPTWKEVAHGLSAIGHNKLADDIMKVYITGDLPIAVDNSVPVSKAPKSESPPPLPPKTDDTELLIPPDVPLTLDPPPVPRKLDMSPPSAPPRPPKSTPSNVPVAPPRPPKSYK